MITGRCHCGNVSYSYDGEIVKTNHCDCRDCQKASGAIKVPFVTVKANSFTFTKTDLKKYNNPKGEKCDRFGEYHFCGNCGTQIYWKGFNADELDVFAGTLDDISIFK